MNSIFSIKPYRIGESSTFVFDDKNTGLVAEAFVCGVSEMMHRAIEKFGINEKKLVCNFSHLKFPSKSLVHLTKLGEDEGGVGTWYRWEDEEMDGWFCPALFKYFPEAPENMYIEFLG